MNYELVPERCLTLVWGSVQPLSDGKNDLQLRHYKYLLEGLRTKNIKLLSGKDRASAANLSTIP